jgi:spermidine/putrescine ABC transporter ATP-binding subunit
MNRIVYLDNVSKIYPTRGGEIYAAREITLDVQPGEFYSLLGSSGSGKTTILRMIGGFEIPEYGQVWIDGENVTTEPPYRRSIHTVFQSYALFPHMTVAQNIAYPLTIAKIPRAEIEPQVTESLRMFRIEGLGDRRPSQLSGGQQQRVALARALISRPKVLLLDEPLSALDAKIREAVRQELRQIQAQLNLTFVYVTHDQEEALALSDRIAVMNQGRLEQVGSPKEIYNRPASAFVAEFIGKANFLQGHVLDVSSDFAWIEINHHRIKSSVIHYVPSVGESVRLMVRPEQLKWQSETADNQISGRLTQVTYIGQISESRLETEIGTLTIAHLGEASDGERSQLFWSAKDCLVLAPEPPPEPQATI